MCVPTRVHVPTHTGVHAHTRVHRRAGTHTHARTDLTDAPPPSSKPPLTRVWNYTVASLPQPPLTSHTQTRGAVILRWDSGFGQEVCVQQDGRGLAQPQDMPVISPSPRAALGERPLL